MTDAATTPATSVSAGRTAARRSGGIARRLVRAAFAASLALLACGVARADNESVAKARSEFVDRMAAAHGFDRAALAAALAEATIDQKIIDTMSRPAERVMPWFEYRAIFLTDARIAAGVRFWTEHAATIDSIAQRYGVDPEMLVAIVGVETYFGTRMGGYRVLDALSTLAFAYPPRAKFFAGELEQFLLLAREEEMDLKAPLGSYAGAMGAGQFIPSSFRSYAVDADDDGKRNIWTDWDDVLGSVANYFKVHGWKTNEPIVDRATRSAEWSGQEPTNKLELDSTVGALAQRGYVFTTEQRSDAPAAAFSFEAEGGGFEYWIGYHNFRVITRYNRSQKYALAAYQLGAAVHEAYLERTRAEGPSVAEAREQPE
jgi:membrane-bound lytic murein transglycosylase B